MRLYILRWNPNISSYKKENHLDLVSHIKNDEQPLDFNWSIREYETLGKDDMFILQQVGTDNDGIAMIGKFKNRCYESDSWRKDGTALYYADMWILDAFDCDSENPLPAKRYEQLFPEIKWHGGHSGVRVEEDLDDKLITQIEKDLVKAGIWEEGELDEFMSKVFDQGPLLDDSGIRFDDGSLLLSAKEEYLKEATEETLGHFIGSFLDSKVLIPMHVEQTENGEDGLFPVLLTNNDGQSLYPVFSNEAQIGDQYQEDDCEVYEIPVPLFIDMVKEDEDTEGVVLDPHTEPLLIDREMIDTIVNVNKIVEENTKKKE